MACDITYGKASLQCKDAISGIKAIYMSNYDEHTFTVGTSGSYTELTITDINDVATSAWYKYSLKNTGNTLNQSIASSRDNGTTMYTQTLVYILNKLSVELEYQIKMQAVGRPQIVVELNSGQWILIGKEHGCEVTIENGVAGSIDGLNGYTCTAVAMEQEPFYYLTANAISYIQGHLSTNNL